MISATKEKYIYLMIGYRYKSYLSWKEECFCKRARRTIPPARAKRAAHRRRRWQRRWLPHLVGGGFGSLSHVSIFGRTDQSGARRIYWRQHGGSRDWILDSPMINYNIKRCSVALWRISESINQNYIRHSIRILPRRTDSIDDRKGVQG